MASIKENTDMITNIHRGIMGTVEFTGKFDSMRKAQDFIVYPLHQGAPIACIYVQSDTRMGAIYLESGDYCMSAPHSGGSYRHDINAKGSIRGKITGEALLALKAGILATASGCAGSNGVVVTDNSGALDVFGAST